MKKMLQSKLIIKHKWDCGIYTLEDMINLVKEGNITEYEFFEITRYNYNGVIKNRGLN